MCRVTPSLEDTVGARLVSSLPLWSLESSQRDRRCEASFATNYAIFKNVIKKKCDKDSKGNISGV